MLPLYPILTRYPFLKAASSVFSFDLESELKNNPDAIEKARRIVSSAMEGKVERDRYVEEAEFFCLGCEERCYECPEIGRLEKCNLCMKCFENCKLVYPPEIVFQFTTKAKLSLLTYIASRMMVSSMEDWVRMRYAVNEASYYSGLLVEDAGESGREPIVRLVALDLGIKLRGWNLHVSTYVRASSRIRDDRWRLVNRKLKDGYVETTKAEFLRVLEELLRIKLFEKVPVSDVVSDAVRAFKKSKKGI
jgi:DNA primase large subunit